jgi:hypothetical protein
MGVQDAKQMLIDVLSKNVKSKPKRSLSNDLNSPSMSVVEVLAQKYNLSPDKAKSLFDDMANPYRLQKG